MTTSVRILLVDEDPAVLDITQTFLEREDDDFEVEAANSVEEAIERADEEPFDAVVSDYKMPHMNGVELASEVREHLPDAPYILFTAKEDPEFEGSLAETEVTGYVQKETGTEQYATLADQIRDAL